jgi:hypothetical protein
MLLRSRSDSPSIIHTLDPQELRHRQVPELMHVNAVIDLTRRFDSGFAKQVFVALSHTIRCRDLNHSSCHWPRHYDLLVALWMVLWLVSGDHPACTNSDMPPLSVHRIYNIQLATESRQCARDLH